VTKADEGVAPTYRVAAQVDTTGTPGGGVGVADLTHEDVRQRLSEYLDNSLGETERRRIDGHLARCRPCTAYLNTLRTTVRALGLLPAPKAPTKARTEILERARRECEASESDG